MATNVEAGALLPVDASWRTRVPFAFVGGVRSPLGTRDDLRIRLHQVLSEPSAVDYQVTVVKMNLDQFKDVNAAYGRAVGDELLHLVGQRLLSLQHAGWCVARGSGDGFVAFLTQPSDPPNATRLPRPTRLPSPTGPTGLVGLLRKVQEQFNDAFVVDDRVVQLRASVGAAQALVAAGDVTVSVERLLHDAEVAMYRAKRDRTGFALFNPRLDQDAVDRLVRIAELRAAITSGQLRVHYQPVVDLRTGATRSVEALVRWQHPDRGLVSPGEFIPLAEECGLIGDLTHVVVEQVLADAVTWKAAGHPLPCAVNVSMQCLTDPATREHLVATFLAHTDVLSLEITESIMANDDAIAVLKQLHEGGVHCAIDDFGTGFSSFAVLKDLPVSVLKIDRAMVKDLATDPREVQIVSAVAHLASVLGLDVIAEGMEDEQTTSALQVCGIRYAQGFYFARPVPLAELLTFLAQGKCSVPMPRIGAPAA